MNITVKAPSTMAQGSQFYTRDGSSVVIGAGGLATIDSKFINDAEAADFTMPGTFGAVTAGLTALSGGGQTGATQLGYGLNQVSVVAAAADSVVLPQASAGEQVTVVNDAALRCQVFGLGSDTINGVAAATGIPQAGNSVITYSCVVAGTWRVVPSLGFSGDFSTIDTGANAITANASGTLAGATALTATLNRVTVNGAANAAVLLPVSQIDMRVRVTNANANACDVFPQANDSITPGATNAVFSIPANKTADFSCAIAGQWDALLSA